MGLDPTRTLKSGDIIDPGDSIIDNPDWDENATVYFEENFNSENLGGFSQAQFNDNSYVSAASPIHHTAGFSSSQISIADAGANGNGEASRTMYCTVAAETVGESNGMAVAWDFPTGKYDLYASANVMFPTDTWWDSGKLPPGLNTPPSGWENSVYDPVTGYTHDGFSCRGLMYDWIGQAFGTGLYYYAPNDPNLYGNASIRAPYFDFSSLIWYNITIRVVCNTFTSGVANADGFMELFIDGTLVNSLNNVVVIRDDGLDIRRMYYAYFYGGSQSTASDKEENMWTDDWMVWSLTSGVRGTVSESGRVINLKYWDRSLQKKLN
ncbi:MAG TPA: hypothetical protein ENH82_15225 [bacterium]|nr:hypothetical protein [bacterium]